MISISCIKYPLTDRVMEVGLKGAVDRAILGGVGVEV